MGMSSRRLPRRGEDAAALRVCVRAREGVREATEPGRDERREGVLMVATRRGFVVGRREVDAVFRGDAWVVRGIEGECMG